MPDSIIEEQPKVEEPKAEVEEKPEEKPAKQDQEGDDEEEEIKAEAAEALKIYSLLKDPKSAADAVRFLAKQAGLEIKEGASESKTVKAAAQVLKESLGAEYEFLAPKLLPGLKALINEEVSLLKGKLIENERAQLSRDWDQAWESLNEQTEGDFEKQGEKIIKEMESFPYNGKQSVKTYLGKLYKMIGGEKPVEKKVSKTFERIKRNAESEEPANSGAGDERVKASSRLPTREEAILAAMKGKSI